jgi:hypothetical protein
MTEERGEGRGERREEGRGYRYPRVRRFIVALRGS